MSMTDTIDPAALTGAQAEGTDGGKLGKIDSIYLDNTSGKPEWAAIKSGLFGGHVSLVPLRDGAWDGTVLRLPFDKEQLRSAPHHDPDTEISVQDEQELYRHYGINHPGGAGDSTGPDVGTPRQETGGRADATSSPDQGPGTDQAMTRSEERLQVGTETHETGRARLRKHIVTEHVTTTVPVQHEEVTIEREPITEANRDAATSGPDLTEAEHEVTLHEERLVTAKETVPVEQVRLGKETVTEDQQINETVRKEQIEAERTGNAPTTQQNRTER